MNAFNKGNIDIQNLLKSLVTKGGSDLHLKAGREPVFRIHKELIPQLEYPVLTQGDLEGIFKSISNPELDARFEKDNEIDFAYISQSAGRFRVNAFRQRGDIGLVMRLVKSSIPAFAALGMPKVLEDIASSESGIILVTGKSSSGKSTTVAAIVEYINGYKRKHVMTLENPIEYLHSDKMSIINQREIGIDTESFHTALKHIIREDPDVIVIGEMRDRETIETAISASETGHLIISSFHADDTTQAVTRLLDFFTHKEREQIRLQLSNTLRAITCQELLKRADGNGLVPAVEVLVNTPIVAEILRKNKLDNIRRVMHLGEHGMTSFNRSLVELVQKKLVTRDEALSKSSNPEALKINLKGIYLDEDKGILG